LSMLARRHQDTLILGLSSFESRVLRRVFTSIIQNYTIKPSQLDPKVAAVWYSTRGCEAAKMSADETRDWLETLHGYKSANVELLEEWHRQLAQGKAGGFQLKVHLTQAVQLMTVLNDHRLFKAAKHDITQAQMDMHSLAAMAKLKPAQQAALYEIHFLAWIVEELLTLISPDAANWMEK
jgi:hypothetical protein